MIKKTREFYGISQEWLAAYLGISRAQLSMAEIGKRKLDNATAITLAKLYQASQPGKARRKSKELEDLAAVQKNKLGKYIKEKLLQQEYALTLAQRSLHNMKADHQRAARVLETVQLLKNTPGIPDKGLFTLIEMNARELYKNTGADAQLHLEIRIKGIQAELSFLKKKRKG